MPLARVTPSRFMQSLIDSLRVMQLSLAAEARR